MTGTAPSGAPWGAGRRATGENRCVDVTLLGTGAPAGLPRPDCPCAACAAAQGEYARAATALLVDGALLLDLTPGAVFAAARAGRSLAGVRQAELLSDPPPPTDGARRRRCRLGLPEPGRRCRIVGGDDLGGRRRPSPPCRCAPSDVPGWCSSPVTTRSPSWRGLARPAGGAGLVREVLEGGRPASVPQRQLGRTTTCALAAGLAPTCRELRATGARGRGRFDVG
ncbi:hypothetical protein STENM327S_07385 [Streptomyces tendae]